jgi:inner membrane protein involved in colicin E2 resistance
MTGPDIEANVIHNAIISQYGLVGFSLVYMVVAAMLIAIRAMIGLSSAWLPSLRLYS